MLKFKKIIATTMFLAASFGAHAKECGVVLDVPPGGAADRYARLLQKYNPDFKVEFRPGGLSVPAVNFLRDNPTYIYLGIPALFGPKSPFQDPPIEMYKILFAAPIMAITTKNITFEQILNSKINLGIPALNTAHDLIAEQLREKNSSLQVISTGGNVKGLPLVINGDLDVFLVSSTDGVKWMSQFPQIKNIFTVELTKPFVKNNVRLVSVGFNGAFLFKNASKEQKELAINCLEKAIQNKNWFEDMDAIGASPIIIGDKAKDDYVKQFVEMLKKYDR